MWTIVISGLLVVVTIVIVDCAVALVWWLRDERRVDWTQEGGSDDLW